MKIILTCGCRYCDSELAHRILVASGLADALPSRREGMTAAVFHERMLKAHGEGPGDGAPPAQLRPGKVWEDLAVDLFLGNLTRDSWGWADPAVVWFLEFWKEFDPQVRFLFVYASPQAVAARALMADALSPNRIHEVVASWAAYQLEVLRFYHRNRDRCLLVNALAPAVAPEGFVRRVASAFELDLAVPAALDIPDAKAPSAIASALIDGLLGASGEPQALYAELESFADVPEGEAGTSVVGWGPAWGEYRRLVRDLTKAEEARRLQAARFDDLVLWGADTEAALTEARAEIAAQRERIEDLGRLVERSVSEWDAQVKVESDLRSTLERQSGELTRLQQEVAALTDCERRCADLDRELQSQRDVLAMAQAAVAEQEDRNSYLVKDNEGLQNRLHALQVELQSQRDALAMAQAAVTEEEGLNAHLVKDNEDMLRQLYAVQEELETYFLRCQELSAAVPANPVGASELGQPWGPMAPVEIRFDLRGDVDGQNWYYPEADGRWAGPERVSTINLPVLGLGRYEVQIEVADAMKPEILDGLRAYMNDTPVSLAREGKRYPALLKGQFPADDLPADGKWCLKLEFPEVVSPADRGSDDRRHLAIRVRSVKLSVVALPVV